MEKVKQSNKERIHEMIRQYISQIPVTVVRADEYSKEALAAEENLLRCHFYGKMGNALIPLPSEYGTFTPPDVAKAWIIKAENAQEKIQKQNPGTTVRLFWAGPGKARVEICHFEEYETKI